MIAPLLAALSLLAPRAVAAPLAARSVPPAAASQEKTFAFDPARDLEEFEKISFSEFERLYPLGFYTSLKGSQIDEAQLAALRARWKGDRERAAERIERIQKEPAERFVFDLERTIENKTFYSKIEYTLDRSFDGFVFLVQKPYKEDATWTERTVSFLGPALKDVVAAFEKRLAEPLRLARRPQPRLWPIVVLSSEGDYAEFSTWDKPAVQLGGRAAFDSRLPAVVTWMSQVPDAQDAKPVRAPVMLALAHALQHAYYAGAGDRPSSLWLYTGLAGYVASPAAPTSDAPGRRAIDVESLDRLVDACTRQVDRDVVLHPVEDLVEARDVRDVVNLARNRADNLGVPPPDERHAIACFRDQATLWTHFLEDGAAGRYRERFRGFVAAAMAGPAGFLDFRVAFQGVDLLQLNRDFYAFLFGEHERHFADEKLDRTALKDLFADRTVEAITEAARAPEPASTTIATPRAVLTPAALAIDPLDLEAHHGMALVQVRGGALEDGLAELERLAAAGPLPPLDARIARDVERTAALIQLRDAYLEHLRTSGGPLVTKYQHQTIVAPVERVADGIVHLGQNPLGVSKVPLTSLDPYELAKQAGRKEERGDAALWARYYAYVLAGDDKWEKLLREKSPEADALRADARDWYPSAIRTGEVALLLDAFAKTPMPSSQIAAGALFESIRAIAAPYAELPIVQSRMETLRELGTYVALSTYEEKDVRELVHGKFLAMGDGRVHIVYEFDDVAEARDFVKDVGYLGNYRKQLESTKVAEMESQWKVEGGELVGSGSACYRHFLGFSAPMTVRYELRFGRPASETEMSPSFYLGICDDHGGSHVLSANFGDLVVNDPGSRYTQRCENARKKIKYNRPYAIEVRNDGKTASTWMEGAMLCDLPCKTRTSGGLFLWFNTDLRIAVQRLEIECKIDPAAIEAMKQSHVRKKLGEMGLR